MFVPKIYTVESVTAGHPDKVCDQISDAILDACITQDPASRVAVEAFGSHGKLFIGGEITTAAKVDFEEVARSLYRDIGYADTLAVEVHIEKQSPDIAQGVDTGGAGDQGIMYGFATGETPEMLPKGVVLAHTLAKGLEALRTSLGGGLVGPDGKTQVTMDNGRVVDVVVSTQHTPELALPDLRKIVTEKLITPIVGTLDGVSVHINPAGEWHLGGFAADTGLTGRKIMVDTYGGLLPHGGGAFSGKDATKVDRSGAYMARLAAKTLIKEGRAKECLVSVAYAIGQAEPVMLVAWGDDGKDLSNEVRQRFDFRPRAIIDRLDLRRPIFRATASYGHFGRPDLPWEVV